jgi:hypothetical protein
MSNIKFKFISGDIKNSFKKKEEEYQDRINAEKQRRELRDVKGYGNDGVGISTEEYRGYRGVSGFSGTSGFSGVIGYTGVSGFSGSAVYAGIGTESRVGIRSNNDDLNALIQQARQHTRIPNTNVGIGLGTSLHIDIGGNVGIGTIPTRQELTVLPADEPNQMIGWTINETVGIGVFNRRRLHFWRIRRFLTRSKQVCRIIYDAIKNDTTITETRRILELSRRYVNT